MGGGDTGCSTTTPRQFADALGLRLGGAVWIPEILLSDALLLQVIIAGTSKKTVDWPPESPDNQYHLFK